MSDEEHIEYILSAEDAIIVGRLSEIDIEKIDQWLLQNITTQWQKVAMVVAKAIGESDREELLTNVPDVFFGMRVKALVSEGKVISQGNLKKMRFSEIKYA